MINALNQKFVAITPPGAIVDNAAFTTAALDTKGFRWITIIVLHSAGMPSSKSSLGNTRGGIARVTIQFTTVTAAPIAGIAASMLAPIICADVAPAAIA